MMGYKVNFDKYAILLIIFCPNNLESLKKSLIFAAENTIIVFYTIMPSYINTLVIQFDTELRPFEVPYFRGAVVASIGDEADILFHNHKEEGFRYSYPLIQYKRIGVKAAIVCIGDGTEAIGQFFVNKKMELTIGDHTCPILVDNIRPHRTLVQAWDNQFRYHLHRWIPLNEANYRAYNESTSLIERLALLERILIGNILSFAKGVGVDIDREIQCSVLAFEEPQIVKVKGIRVMAFDLDFSTNVSMPNFIGLGKHASFGFGVLTFARSKNHTDNNHVNEQIYRS